MPVEDKKIKHFILMRFFSFDDPKYPHDIYDPDFLAKQLVLAKNNALSSLENQTNKNFDLVFMVNAKFFNNPKYEFVFSTLKDSTTLPLTFIRPKEIPELVKKAFNDYDFVITSRMDFDDFVFKGAIADTHSKVDLCENILAYGYCKGYSYVLDELYHDFRFWGRIGYQSILGSVILKSSFIRELPFIDAYFCPHQKIKEGLEDYCKKNGVKFSEHMFQQNTTTNAYIYVRHGCSHFILTRLSGEMQIPNKPPLTSKDITKEQLADEFGFHLELKSIK